MMAMAMAAMALAAEAVATVATVVSSSSSHAKGIVNPNGPRLSPAALRQSKNGRLGAKPESPVRAPWPSGRRQDG